MFQRGIAIEDVESALEDGQTIEDYPDDFPYPSRLICGFSGARPLHVVVADNENANERIIITVYEPNPSEWDENFTKRKS